PKKYPKILNKEEISNFAYSHGPFLVIYTEDNEIDEELNDNKNKRIKREIFQSTDDNLQIKEHMNLVRRQAEYFAYGMALPQEPLPLDNDLQKPIKNIPNEFHDTKFALRRRKMKNRRKNKQKLSRKISFDANDPMLGFGTNKSPWERSIKENKFGNSLNDFKELEDNERDVMMINKNEKNDEEINMGIKGGGSIKKCSRHNLTIDIRELGLNERIIAPKTFETGYCAGSCEYPLDKSLRPSNHAIFQSLIVKLQSITNNNITTKIEKTPSVCCAPDKFDSLTMLYFNENGNLVLKNFPRMIVLKCGCI
uniref:TGF_BETA_2 domain-containing protein n=1 Tax=Meloidogyne hapla TaxID=6305 RepID=A0A1I8B7W6_MELHA